MRSELALLGQPMAVWLAPDAHGAISALFAAPGQMAGEVSSGQRPETAFAKPERINPTKRELRFIVPLTDGETYLGDLELAVSPQDMLSVDSVRLLDLMKPVLQPAIRLRLGQLAGTSGRIDEPMLAKADIRLVYNAQNLSLDILIPVKDRQTRVMSFRGEREAQADTFQPAPFSAYLNVYSAMDLVEAGASRGVVPPTAAFDAAIRARGVVVENEAYVSGRSQEPAFRRTGSRVVYEDVRWQMRWTLGDIQLYARQFQDSPTVFGLGVSRIYSQIDPQREIRTSGAQSFGVISPSVIETFVNGRSVERRTFQPGNYTLQDFPLAQGANAVQLRIEDSSGKIRTIDFSVYANQSLLAKGVTEFSLFGGVYSTATLTGFHYSRDWIANGFIYKGLAEQLTAGLNFQANDRHRQAGTEILWGSPIGLAGLNLAANSSQAGDGLAVAMTYERLLSQNGGAHSQSIRAAIEWRSSRFDLAELTSDPTRPRLRASAGYVITLGRNSFVAADLQYARDYRAAQSNYGGRLSGGFDLGERIAATAEFGINRGEPNRDTYVRVGLRMRFGGRGLVQIDADSKGRTRANFSASHGGGVGAWQGSANLEQDANAVSFTANGTLSANRAELGVQESVNWDKRSGQFSDARTTLRAAFAIAYADGSVALGRPITEAFMIAAPHRSLNGKAVYVDPNEQSEAARSGQLGPALDGQLGAHSFRTLVYQVPDAPSGYDLGAGNVSISPPYRAGYRLVIGSDYHLLVIGRLLDGGGEPIK